MKQAALHKKGERSIKTALLLTIALAAASQALGSKISPIFGSEQRKLLAKLLAKQRGYTRARTAYNGPERPNQLRNNTSPFPFPPKTDKVKIFPEPGNEMFYWIFKAKKNPAKAPVVIWLQGGPGCASSGGLFTEIGPYYLKNYNKTNLDERLISWNDQANLLFVDQPLGVGLSTVTDGHVVKDFSEVGDQFLTFYEGFLRQNPEYKGRPIFVTGESYGGHWIPYTALALYEAQNPDINLAGISIGNGYLDALSDYATLADFSYKYRNYTYITEEMTVHYRAVGALCGHMFLVRPYNRMYTYNTLDICASVENGIISHAMEFNKDFDQYYMPSDKPGNGSAGVFLNRPEVQAYLNVSTTFYSCNNTFEEYFLRVDNFVDSREMIIKLLHSGIKVQIYDGALDFICNYMMEEHSLATMDWVGVNEWNKRQLVDCKYGLCKQVRNLRYIRFAGAGHMVPNFNQPLALEMMNEFFDWGLGSSGGDSEEEWLKGGRE